MIVSICADKGSPGVTTAATALAMAWAGELVVLEADTSGGDLALLVRTPEGELLPPRPSVRSLAVDARTGAVPGSLAAYAHDTSLGIPVIPATDMRSDDFAMIANQWVAVANVARSWQGTVIADLGRLQESNPAGALAAASATVLLIGRSTATGLYHLRERAQALVSRLGQGEYGRSPLAVAVICPPREHKARVQDLRTILAADPATSTIPVAGWLADDLRAVAALRAGQVTTKLLKSDLIRSARELAATLQASSPAALEALLPAPAAHRAWTAADATPGMHPVAGAPRMDVGGWSA